MSYRMPAEWLPHKRTWMAWPCNPDVLELVGAEASYRAWSGVANAVNRFEPVVMVCNHGDAETARGYLDDGVQTLEVPLGDSWMRDIGPSFVVDEDGRLGAVDWTFNGWGGRTFPTGSADADIAKMVARRSDAELMSSKLVNEGGAIHVDGEGTLLVTESVQLNRNRNPSWTRQEVEVEMNRLLGTSKVIWLPRGVLADTGALGTDGHVDTLACFVKPGVVVIHGQPDPSHPDHDVANEIEAIMQAETDAGGRELEVIVLDAPKERYVHGEPLSCSYVNFSFVNNGVVLCAFDDPKDEETAGIFRTLFPEREVVSVDAVPIFAGGGGVHCITQQEPLCKSNGG